MIALARDLACAGAGGVSLQNCSLLLGTNSDRACGDVSRDPIGHV